MSVRRRRHMSKNGPVVRWVVDINFWHPDGRYERVRKVSPVQTRKGAEQYDREMRKAMLAKEAKSKRLVQIREAERRDPKVKVPTFAAFSKDFLVNYAKANNKPSEVNAKTSIMKMHLVP